MDRQEYRIVHWSMIACALIALAWPSILSAREGIPHRIEVKVEGMSPSDLEYTVIRKPTKARKSYLKFEAAQLKQQGFMEVKSGRYEIILSDPSIGETVFHRTFSLLPKGSPPQPDNRTFEIHPGQEAAVGAVCNHPDAKVIALTVNGEESVYQQGRITISGLEAHKATDLEFYCRVGDITTNNVATKLSKGEFEDLGTLEFDMPKLKEIDTIRRDNLVMYTNALRFSAVGLGATTLGLTAYFFVAKSDADDAMAKYDATRSLTDARRHRQATQDADDTARTIRLAAYGTAALTVAVALGSEWMRKKAIETNGATFSLGSRGLDVAPYISDTAGGAVLTGHW